MFVAEELGDVDEDLVEQRPELFGVDLEVIQIDTEVIDAELGASLADPPDEAGALVSGEIKAARVAQILDELLEFLA